MPSTEALSGLAAKLHHGRLRTLDTVPMRQLASRRLSAERPKIFAHIEAPRERRPMSFALSPEREREMDAILSRYPNRQAACIPVLHLCQEQVGWVSPEVIDFVAQRLDLTTAHVKGVVTFYTLFNKEPVGKHTISVCKTLSCALRGSAAVVSHLEKRLGVHVGETTKDGRITLRTVECLASCGSAPMMQVGKKYHENLTIEEVDRIVDRLLED